jgi:hypothetical protein
MNVSTPEKVFSPHQKVFFSTRSAQLMETRTPRLYGQGLRFLASQGKRDKYRYEAECVTDVPIGCILNR